MISPLTRNFALLFLGALIMACSHSAVCLAEKDFTVSESSWRIPIDPPQFPWTQEPNLDPEVVLLVDSHARIVIPAQPSPYMAIGTSSRTKAWSCWDLRQGQKLSTFNDVRPGALRAAISCDGRWLANCNSRNRGEIRVLSLETGELVKTLGSAESRDRPVQLIWMAEQHLVSISNDAKQFGVIHHIPSGKEIALKSKNLHRIHRTYASSPGGNYLAAADPNARRIEVFDIHDGALVGELELPTHNGVRKRVNQLAFSTGGDDLAAVLEDATHERDQSLVVWNTADGTLKSEVQLHQLGPTLRQVRPIFPALRPIPLARIPNSDRWLIQGSILVRDSLGELDWSYVRPAVPERQCVLAVLGSRHLLTVCREPSDKKRIAVEQLPTAEIEASRMLVHQGGTPLDYGLPPLVAVDWKKIERRTRPTQVANGYQSTGDPELASAWAVDKNVNGQENSAIQFNLIGDANEEIIRLQFCGTDTPLATMLSYPGGFHAALSPSSSAPRNPNASKRPAFRIQTLDIRQEKIVESHVLQQRAVTEDVSQSGAQVLLRGYPRGRLDLWDLQRGMHLWGIRPFQTESSYLGADVRSAKFVGDSRLLTLSSVGEVVLWQLPSFLPLYSKQYPDKSQLRLTPNRKYFALSGSGFVQLASVDTGEIVMELSYESSGHTPHAQAIAFQHNGKRLALLDSFLTHSQMRVWNLENQQLVSQMEFPFLADIVSWCGEEVLLAGISGRALVNKRRDASSGTRRRMYHPEMYRYALRLLADDLSVVWCYETTRFKFVSASPDGRCWFCNRERKEPGSTLLAIGAQSPKTENNNSSRQERPKQALALNRLYLGKGMTRLTSTGLEHVPLPVALD